MNVKDLENKQEAEQQEAAKLEALHFRLGELEAALAKQAAPQAAEMGFSLNFKLDGKTVRDVQLTLRAPAHTGADEVMAHFKEMFTAHEWHFPEPPPAAPQKAVAAPTSAADMAEATGKGVIPPSVKPQAQAVAPQGEQSFAASQLVGSVADGKAYWKVKGGQFTKFGVTVWPEVLQASGFDLNGLVAGSSYSLEGRTAYYVCKADGKPDKVTRIE